MQAALVTCHIQTDPSVLTHVLPLLLTSIQRLSRCLALRDALHRTSSTCTSLPNPSPVRRYRLTTPFNPSSILVPPSSLHRIALASTTIGPSLLLIAGLPVALTRVQQQEQALRSTHLPHPCHWHFDAGRSCPTTCDHLHRRLLLPHLR